MTVNTKAMVEVLFEAIKLHPLLVFIYVIYLVYCLQS